MKIFKATISKNLAEGIDVAGLLEVGNKAGIDLSEEFAENFGLHMQELADKKLDLTEFIRWAEDREISAGQALGEDFSRYFYEFFRQDRLNKLFQPLDKEFEKFINKERDISGLIKAAQKQGFEIGDVFGENYTEIVQLMIEKGYDITEMLKWGEKSGISAGDMVGEKYRNGVQSCIDKEYDIGKLIQWAKKSGKSVGNIFGENFNYYVNRWLAETSNSFSEWQHYAQEGLNSLNLT